MYKYIRVAPPTNILRSSVAYLYQNVNTKKYYISSKNPNAEDIIDHHNPQMYMLLNNEQPKPIIIHKDLLTNIGDCLEITNLQAKTIKFYSVEYYIRSS